MIKPEALYKLKIVAEDCRSAARGENTAWDEDCYLDMAVLIEEVIDWLWTQKTRTVYKDEKGNETYGIEL